MNYKIYTRPNYVSGTYVILEVNENIIFEKHCMTMIGARWYAYHLYARVKAGKYVGYGSIYEGTMK